MKYREIVNMLEIKAKKYSIPFNGHFELTSKCNLNCPFCYEKDRFCVNELTENEWLRIIKEAIACGMFRATFTAVKCLQDAILKVYIVKHMIWVYVLFY